MDVGEVKKNTKVLIRGVPHNVESVDFVKPGKGRAIYRMKLRNLFDGSLADITYHSGDELEGTEVTTQEMQYLYSDEGSYIFMNTETFEQQAVGKDILGDKANFLKEGMMVQTTMFEDRAIDITLPIFVELKVVQTEVALKTATAAPQGKSAILETGYTVEVPPFVREGDVIKIDTRSGAYVERVETGK
jgi:elongation factor P